MFVCIKKHRSGNSSVVVVDKSGGRYRQIKSFGIIKSESHQQSLIEQAQQLILRYGGQQQLEFEDLHTPSQSVDYVLSHIENIHMDVTYQILSRVYDEIGFNAIDDNNVIIK